MGPWDVVWLIFPFHLPTHHPFIHPSIYSSIHLTNVHWKNTGGGSRTWPLNPWDNICFALVHARHYESVSFAVAQGLESGSDSVIEFCSFSSLITELEPQANPAFFSSDLIGPLFQTFVDKGIKKSVDYCIHHIQINMLHYHKDKERSCNIFSKLLIERAWRW